MEERNKLIIEIMALAYLVNEKTDFCTFIDYSGHVDSLNIKIAESKTNYLEDVASTEIRTKFLEYYKADKNDELAYLKAKRDVFRDILETGGVDISEMDEEVEEIIHHYF